MKRIASAIIALLMASEAISAPSISGVTVASVATGQTAVVVGNGFGTKTRSKLILWADGQEGSLAPHTSLSFYTSIVGDHMKLITDSNKRWGAGAFRSDLDYTSATRVPTLSPSTITVNYATRIMVSWWEKSDVGPYIPQNWKIGVRWWHTSSSASDHYPSHYFASLASGSSGPSNLRFNTEFPTASTGLSSNYGFPTTTWRRVLALYKMNTSLGSGDGTLQIYKNGTLTTSITGWNFNDGTNTAFANRVYFQHGIANANWPSGSNWWVTDLALDDSWNRFEIGNASTYAACTQFELQPYTAYSNTAATLNLRLGTITGNAWLYACDINNDCNASGFALVTSTISAPSISNITPNHGPASGFTSIVIDGANFLSTPTVKLNGIFATSVAMVNSSQITAVTPAGVAGTSVNVDAINGDGQSATAVLGFSYDAISVPSTANTSPVPPWIIRSN